MLQTIFFVSFKIVNYREKSHCSYKHTCSANEGFQKKNQKNLKQKGNQGKASSLKRHLQSGLQARKEISTFTISQSKVPQPVPPRMTNQYDIYRTEHLVFIGLDSFFFFLRGSVQTRQTCHSLRVVISTFWLQMFALLREVCQTRR